MKENLEKSNVNKYTEMHTSADSTVCTKHWNKRNLKLREEQSVEVTTMSSTLVVLSKASQHYTSQQLFA